MTSLVASDPLTDIVIRSSIINATGNVRVFCVPGFGDDYEPPYNGSLPTPESAVWDSGEYSVLSYLSLSQR